MNSLWTKLSVLGAGAAIFALACTVTSGGNDGSSADDSASDDDASTETDGSVSNDDATTAEDSGMVSTCSVGDDQLVDTTCTTCGRTKCCAELDACWGNADCKAFASCVIECQSDGGTDEACVNDVCKALAGNDEAAQNATIAKDDAWRACLVGTSDADGGITGKCNAECGD